MTMTAEPFTRTRTRTQRRTRGGEGGNTPTPTQRLAALQADLDDPAQAPFRDDILRAIAHVGATMLEA